MVETPTLVLNDGTQYVGSQCGYADHHLWCFMKGIGMAEAFAVFSNPEKTQTIKFWYGNTEEVYTGFTEINVLKVSEFSIDLRLVGENTSVDVHTMPVKEEESNASENV